MELNSTKSHDFTTKFNDDLRYGQSVEAQLYTLLHEKKLEVKSDVLWSKNHHLAIEVRFKGQPSGVSSTEADYWIHALPDSAGKPLMWMMFDVGILRQLVRMGVDSGIKPLRGGDNGDSLLVLIPLTTRAARGIPTLWDLLDGLL